MYLNFYRSSQPDYYNRSSTKSLRGLNKQSMITPVLSQETSDKEYLYQVKKNNGFSKNSVEQVRSAVAKFCFIE